MSYIKFNLVKMDKALVFQILNQNLRKSPNANRRWSMDMDIDGYKVLFRKSAKPEIKFDLADKTLQVFGRGHDSGKHLDPQIIYFEDNFDRDEIFDILVKTLRSVSEKIK